jgi:hypothetical protein
MFDDVLDFDDLVKGVKNEMDRPLEIEDDTFDTGLPTHVDEKWTTGQEPDVWSNK